MLKNNKLLVLWFCILVATFFLFNAGVFKTGEKELVSQKIMQTAMNVVRDKKPTPSQTSFFYATVAQNYYDGVYVNKSLNSKEKVDMSFSTSTLETVLQEIVDKDNQNSNGFKLRRGVENWNLFTEWTDKDKKPFSPNATLMPRFVVDQNFTYQVPPPPVYGGAEFRKALNEVKEAASTRTPEQGALVNFWGGIPGTEGPSGIWLNRLVFYTKKYNSGKGLSDEQFAYAQMVLAKSLADSFMECWKVKFIYQTKRPDMTDKSITPLLAMANPPFPSYVSGHSTISFTAATVLAKMFPKDADSFFADATNAKNSRLYAGIHFPYDNNEGEKLGRAVGEFVVSKLNLTEIR